MLQSFVAKLAIQLLHLLPFKALYLLSRLLRFFIFSLAGYRKNVVRANLQNAFPEKTEAEISTIAQRFQHHFTDVLLESLKGLTLKKSELQSRFHYRNPAVFLPYFEKNQSAILLGSHYGNWEWGVLSIPLVMRHKVLGIYKPLKNKQLDTYFNSLRKQWGLLLTDMAHAGRVIVQQKNEPTIFVFIADQTPIDVRNAHWLNFLHQDTPFLHGADKLARQTGFPVFYCEILRMKSGYYEVNIQQICEANEPLAEGEITQRYAAMLEATIQRSPSEWLWSHRRWKRKRPAANPTVS